jgi:hypothetical protein
MGRDQKHSSKKSVRNTLEHNKKNLIEKECNTIITDPIPNETDIQKAQTQLDIINKFKQNGEKIRAGLYQDI